MDFIISDQYKRLLKVQQEVFPGSPRQKCICQFMRHVLSKFPYKERPVIANYFKQIFYSTSRKMAIDIAHLIVQEYQESYPKASRQLEEERESYLRYFCLRLREIDEEG